jgi:hypothetical protein
MIRIKLTQSVKMEADHEIVILTIYRLGQERSSTIPAKSVFQVKRGLESYVQKFYRKHDKKSA